MVRVPASSSSILRGPRPPSPSWPNSRYGSALVRQGASGIVAVSVVPAPGGLSTVEPAAERLDARRQALQPGAARGAGAAGAVVGDLGDERAPVLGGGDAQLGRGGVLERVGERLGDEEPHRRLDHRR